MLLFETGNSQGRLLFAYTNVPHAQAVQAEVCHNRLPEPLGTLCFAALQDAWTPLKVASAVAIINLAGDYYLIIQRGLGVIGAGITCPVAQYFGAIVFIIYLQRMGRRDKGIPLSWQVLHHTCSRQLDDPWIGCTVCMLRAWAIHSGSPKSKIMRHQRLSVCLERIDNSHPCETAAFIHLQTDGCPMQAADASTSAPSCALPFCCLFHNLTSCFCVYVLYLQQPNSVNVSRSAATYVIGDTTSKGPTDGTLLAKQ